MNGCPLLGLPTSEVDRERVESALKDSVRTPDAYLTEIASHLLLAGGKRLRPMFSVVAAQVAGGPTTDAAVQGGIACELVHLGSLYHDDVMDESPTRRGVDTVNAKWGNLQAILAGDFLLARASEIAASLGTEVAGLLARTIGRLCEGQIEELRHTYNVARPVDSYLSSIAGKTASLYATAARIGGLVSGFPAPVTEALTEFGEAYGMVFQIVDDLLDISSTDEELGKPAGHDMVEGVYTYPVLHTLMSGGTPARELADLLGSPLSAVEKDKAMTIVRGNGGIEAARRLALDYVGVAQAACDRMPNSAATEALRATPAALLASV
ncbi:MAG: polyprenyl synthetase family protein [Actinomycetota bacterium]|nr:polyprenyl synthetase family protein [Actinomycetota bacterium]MDA2971658.1 polyprenyl synthetase family protein [Actinomycetota bacterium]MDA3000218.1 polyprenyl synthetase family protein [Actinomycetota bacterium]